MVELPDLARRLLEGKNFATVATVMGDGRPQASVVWIDIDGNHNPYQQAMIQGRVVAMEHEGAEEHIDAMAKKYMDLDSYPFRKESEQRVIVRIAPEKVALMP